MATAKLYNLARMTTATTGTGTITLGSAATGFISFATAGVSDGESITYAIEDGNNREIGRGTYTASGTTLTRSVLKSTNAGSAINLSGSAQVFITDAAEDHIAGPASATDNAVVRFDGTGGATIQNSVVTVADTTGTLSTSGGGDLGVVTTAPWGNVFLASAKKIDFNAGDVTITHSANSLAFAGAASGYTFDAAPLPSANDGAALGASGTAWADLFLASGGVINWNAGNVTVTHASNALSFNIGASNPIKFGRDSVDNRYGIISVNNDTTSTGAIGIRGGATGGVDGSLYLMAVTGGGFTFLVNYVSVGSWDATGLSVGTSNKITTGTIELGAASDTTLSRASAGVLAVEGVNLTPNIPINSQSAAYGIVLADANTCIYHPSSDNNARTFTIPANGTIAFPVGTFLTFVNEINTVTIAITTDTLTLAGTGTTGSRTLAANGVATALKVASTKWVINGTGLT